MMSRIFKRIMDEALRVLPAVIYFFIAFNLFRLTFGQMFTHVGIPCTPLLSTIIWALIIGKIMIIADHLPFLNIFSKKPLIYNTLWRTSVYFIFSFLFRVIEHLVPLVRHHQDIAVASQHFLKEMWWARFWTIQIWYLILLLVFVVFQELVRGVGRDKLRIMFFGR